MEADHLQLRGAVVVDDGAARKVRDEGKKSAADRHDPGSGGISPWRCDCGAQPGRYGGWPAGLANYGSSEARLIARRPSSAFEGLLGYTAEPEMIHRDNLVLSN